MKLLKIRITHRESTHHDMKLFKNSIHDLGYFKWSETLYLKVKIPNKFFISSKKIFQTCSEFLLRCIVFFSCLSQFNFPNLFLPSPKIFSYRINNAT